ncbi:peptidase domain-containing ABC transporter [Aquirufa nivalisilvae]
MKKPFIIKQQGQSDCGVSCLLSIIRYYGGNSSFEYLRRISGTTLHGTSMLGLKQAAQRMNLDAEAFEVEDFSVFNKEAIFPCILHIHMEGNLEHFIICFKAPSNESIHYIIGDPASGIEFWTEEKLLLHWKSKTLLCLTPNNDFKLAKRSSFIQIKWLIFNLRNDFSLLIIASILGIIVAILGISTAIFIQNLLDQILPKNQFQKLVWGLPLLTTIFLARTIIEYLRGKFLNKQALEFNIRVFDEFYCKLLHLPNQFFKSRKTGEIITRINDTRRIQETVSYIFGNVIIDFLVILTSIGFIFFYSKDIGFVVLFSIPIFVYLSLNFSKKVVKSQKDVFNSYSLSESHFIDAITGIHIVKAFNRENYFLAIAQKIYSNFQNKIFFFNSISNQYKFLGEFSNSIFISLVLGICIFYVLEKQIMIGEMMAIITIATNLISAISRTIVSNIRFQEASVTIERMFEFTKLEFENCNFEEIDRFQTFNTIIVKEVSFSFPGKSSLFAKLNFEIKRGELTIIFGKIGSGKSILLQILQKVYDYDSGSILVGDLELNQIDLSYWRNHIGIISQDVKIFNTTLLENIILDDSLEEREKVIDFCNKWGFAQFIDEMPNSYLTIVGENGVQLSGGQKQLIELIRALFRMPDILLLDEPTSSMDETTEKFVFEVLEKFKCDMAILMVSHRKSSFTNADKIFELKTKTLVQIK